MGVITGSTHGWWETGTEGVNWTIVANWEKPYWDYGDLHILENGDHLVITKDGVVVFDGVVKLRRNINVVGANGWQAINGMYVQGVQDGVSPELWFEWFMAKPGTYLATVTR